MGKLSVSIGCVWLTGEWGHSAHMEPAKPSRKWWRENCKLIWELQTDMRIANIHVGTIPQKVRIANWYENCKLIWKLHLLSLQFSCFCVLFLRGRLQFSYVHTISSYLHTIRQRGSEKTFSGNKNLLPKEWVMPWRVVFPCCGWARGSPLVIKSNTHTTYHQ